MPSLHKVRKLPNSPLQLFDMVLDIESYPEFLPWCKSARIKARSEEQIIAELAIYFKGITEKYESYVTYYATQDIYEIKVEAISGPFKYLINKWIFSPIEDGTRVDFFIDFKFKSILFDKLMGLFFTEGVEKMIKAFEARAEKLYMQSPQN